jgi:hypothetical protein
LDRLLANFPGVLPVLLLDELHKYALWKNWLKGLYDTYKDRLRILVTGSARLEVYRRGGDSMMGRYFLYRMHPLSVAELLHAEPADHPVRPPAPPEEDDWRSLYEFGGFPGPFVSRDPRDHLRWLDLRRHQLVKEDLRDLGRILELSLMQALVAILDEHSSAVLVYSTLAREIGISVDTVRRWIQTLVLMHHGFLLRPWAKRVKRSLRKEPKWYLRDGSGIQDSGQRTETFIACHLLKAVEGWTDLGLGVFELFYLRDTEKREVDFLVVRDGKPFFLAEAKKSDTKLSQSLEHFQKALGAPHAFQVVLDLPYKDADCFQYHHPIVVPARTLSLLR